MRNTNKPPYAATEISKKPPTTKQLEVFNLRLQGWTEARIAAHIGKSRSAVQNRIRLLRNKGYNVP